MSWPPVGFVEAGPRSRKLACVTCGEKGYAYGKWMARHRRPHLPCPWCGRRFAVKLDGTARVHTRCPNRPESVVQHVYAPTTGDAKQSGPDTTRRTP